MGILTLLALVSPAVGAPKWCRPCPTCPPDLSQELDQCVAELDLFKPLVQPAVIASARVGIETAPIRIFVPAGVPSRWFVDYDDANGVPYATASWTVRPAGAGAFDVTVKPVMAGKARLAWWVVINGELREYPVEVTVVP